MKLLKWLRGAREEAAIAEADMAAGFETLDPDPFPTEVAPEYLGQAEVRLTREELERLITREEMDLEAIGIYGNHFLLRGPVQTKLGDKLRAALDQGGDAIARPKDAQPSPESGSEVEAPIDHVLERFRPTRAVFDMGGGATQEVDWRSVVGHILYYADKIQPQPESGSGEEGGRTGIRCESCDREQRVGDEGWESHNMLDWCPDCWVEDEIERPASTDPSSARDANLALISAVSAAKESGISARGIHEVVEALLPSPTQPLQGSEAERFAHTPEKMWPTNNGDWVWFTDYTALQAQLQSEITRRVDAEGDLERAQLQLQQVKEEKESAEQKLAREVWDTAADRDMYRRRAIQAEARLQKAAQDFEDWAAEENSRIPRADSKRTADIHSWVVLTLGKCAEHLRANDLQAGPGPEQPALSEGVGTFGGTRPKDAAREHLEGSVRFALGAGHYPETVQGMVERVLEEVPK